MTKWSKSDIKFLYKLIAVVFVFLALLGIGLYNQLQRERKLKNGFTTKAVITWRTKAHLKGGHNGKVRYKINNKIFNHSIVCGCQENEIGDTVLIRVAFEDFSIISMVDHKFEKRKEFYSEDELKELSDNFSFFSRE